ncbi:hypothetical protein [Streptomyces sp. NBC_00083]|uniref:hypothetical protein n=1 Tax=Streptomyces sp. NBC_00083 TaxID=2975647 RepID=UPI0022546267|nr:hypothetical protein [Streptomyces sp. NBC_00083]MCX5387508.1 hypothetical protein [Streptomyces sp. NBC_00083]
MLLEDGTEPGPAIFDAGSGAYMHQSYRWQDYDGMYSNPQASALRGACSCGWRGETRYPLSWATTDGENWVEEPPTGDCKRDWNAHLEQVEAASAEVPDKLDKRVTKLVRQLDNLSVDEPLTVLKVVERLDRQLKEVRQATAYQVLSEQECQEDGRSWEEIAAALALPIDQVQSRLLHYQRGH